MTTGSAVQEGRGAGGPREPVIAIDGPGGSGKSTVAREVARRLGWRYLDTGAMYRALTLAVLASGVALDDAEGITKVTASSTIAVNTDPDDAWTELDGERVSESIRGRAVTAAVSAVSAVPAVRAALVASQQALVGAGAIVVEGRDIGSTVVPDADVKIFLTADVRARAVRRLLDAAAPESSDLTATHEEIRTRDDFDSSRLISPLAKAADAVEIDATDMSVADVVAAILLRCESFAPLHLQPLHRQPLHLQHSQADA